MQNMVDPFSAVQSPRYVFQEMYIFKQPGVVYRQKNLAVHNTHS